MNSTASFDQASGLRELFGTLQGSDSLATLPLPKVMALVSPARPSLVLPMAQVCSRQLQRLQMRHAWVDELDFDLREEWPMPCPVRFDLGQALAGHVPLASALKPFDRQLGWYAPARRLAQPQAGAPSLSERLADSGLDFDWVMVSAHPRQPRLWHSYGAEVRPVILSEATPQALEQGMTWAQHTSGQTRHLAFDQAVWVLLGDQADALELARAEIDTQWRAWTGRAPARICSAPLQTGQGLAKLPGVWQASASELVEWLCLQ